MVRPNKSSGNKKRSSQPNAPLGLSIDEVLDTVDTGDDTQHRFRYQHAYGVILLLAALSDNKQYTYIYCEHHEDLLGRRKDGFFDAYQIKTRRDGSWNLLDDPFRDSIKRFVGEHQLYSEGIKEFFFVSNARSENSTTQNKIGRNPKKFLQAVKHAFSPDDLEQPFSKVFEELRLHCACDSSSLMAVLKKLTFLTGPGLDSFEAEIAQNHLSAISECHSLPAKALGQLVDDLIAKVYKASCLSITNPMRHLYDLDKNNRYNPKIQAKRISVESVLTFIRENQERLLSLVEETPTLSKRLKETLNLYLNQSFDDDRVAKLDQAGETDSERTTLLHQVFVDLELKPRNDQRRPPRALGQYQLSLFENSEHISEITYASGEKPLSAMECFLTEITSKIVIIGGPGQGKSTLGQYLAQIHRAVWCKREKELDRDTAPQKKFHPKTARIPFRIVLKYFAQWLADGPALDTVEAYIAEQISLATSRPGEIDAATIHDILKAYPILLILDGLDEVTEQTLCNRMLTCVERFLARTERLRVNIQIIATSRPQGYSDQFPPKLFWHLELQPLSAAKAKEYTACWTHVKVSSREEQRRIKETLEECLGENHTRPLLATPLQVTIILLIIKDGGRPPTQREELFQQYWTTILGREKSKTKGMIRTGDTRLFGLHAYLGYLLHRNATGRNIRSLFPADKFEQIVCDFLKSSDDISPPEDIRQQAAQMVAEARMRLVLLVEPEPGFFGFELRSLQEFFAGAYLAQTARDTERRFARLRAIAYSEHWRNVTLFCAGHIVRDFPGEAANILEVCRDINRSSQDAYLCRGAWLALDIAADGIFTTNNRNLQYSALEIALTVMNTGMTAQQRNHLVESISRLPLEDRRDILSKLLKQKLLSLPSSCLPPALELYGECVNTENDFTLALEALLSTNKRQHILEALNMGFRKKVSPQWLALQLETYWQHWITEQPDPRTIEWWLADLQYMQNLVAALSWKEDHTSQIMSHILSLLPYRSRFKNNTTSIKEPKKHTEQIITLLQCLHLSGDFQYRTTFIELYIGKSVKISFKKQHKIKNTKRHIDSDLLASINQLISRPDLMPQLRACLWVLYWKTHEPTEAMIKNFVNESRAWIENHDISMFLRREAYGLWPIFQYSLEDSIEKGQDMVVLPQALSNIQEFSTSTCRKVGEALQNGLNRLPYEEQLAIVLYGRYPKHLFPELGLIADQLQVNSEQLIDICTGSLTNGIGKLSSKTLQYLFLYAEKDLEKEQRTSLNKWFISSSPWILDNATSHHGLQILQVLVEMLPQYPVMLQEAFILFLKLIIFEGCSLPYTPEIFSYLEEDTYIAIWHVADELINIPIEHLTALANFTTDKNDKIRQGAITFWVNFIKLLLSRPYVSSRRQLLKLDNLNFDCNHCLSLINETKVGQKVRGITLLIYSHISIKDKPYLTILLEAMKQTEDDETAAWALFLENVPINSSERKTWIELLETLLNTPQSYSSEILTAAMERYIQLMGIAGPEIKDEQTLGLPLLTLPKRKREKPNI